MLQRIARAPQQRAGGRCEMCSVEIGAEHGHVVDLSGRSLLCACRPCYLLFDYSGRARGRYRAVPDRYFSFPEFRLTRQQWDALQIPVGIAFFFVNSDLDQTAAFYPSPAGATESVLPLDRWEELLEDNPELATAEPDIEALLVRVQGDEAVCYLVPIDACYELVGLIRLFWKGFDGGQEARERIEGFFTDVSAKSRPFVRREVAP